MKTDSQFYDEWVGSQTPKEFAQYAESEDIEQAVEDYDEETAKGLDADDTDLDILDDVKAALVRYIRNALSSH